MSAKQQRRFRAKILAYTVKVEWSFVKLMKIQYKNPDSLFLDSRLREDFCRLFFAGFVIDKKKVGGRCHLEKKQIEDGISPKKGEEDVTLNQ
jgi:hypothetical protein